VVWADHQPSKRRREEKEKIVLHHQHRKRRREEKEKRVLHHQPWKGRRKVKPTPPAQDRSGSPIFVFYGALIPAEICLGQHQQQCDQVILPRHPRGVHQQAGIWQSCRQCGRQITRRRRRRRRRRPRLQPVRCVRLENALWVIVARPIKETWQSRSKHARLEEDN